MSQAGSFNGGSGGTSTVAVDVFQPNAILQEFDDFISANNAGNYSKLTWDILGSAPRSLPGTSTNPGILSFGNQGTGNSGLYLRQAPTAGNQIDPIPIGAGRLSQSWVVQLDTLSGGGNTYRFSCGFADAETMNGATPDAFVDGIYFQYTNTVNGGNWTLNCTNTSVTTTVNTAVAVATDFVTLSIIVNSGATSVSFYVDDALVGTAITTNIPTVSLTPMAIVVRTAGTNNVLNVDLYYINLVLTTPRPGPTFGEVPAGTPSGTVLQQVRAKITGSTTAAATFYGPAVPTTADMDLLLSATITPTSASSVLIFEVFGSGSCAGPPDYPLLAIFQSGVTDAIFANSQGHANAQYTFSPKYYMVAGTTSSTTFSVYHSSYFGNTFTYNDLISTIGEVTFIITEVVA